MILNDNIFIVAHGDSKLPYIKEFIQYISQYKNVIYSSWNDTPKEIIELLEEKRIKYILNPYPEKEGMSKLNYQKMGFLYGLEEAKKNGAKFIYKMRNDLIISNLDVLLNKLKFEIENGGKLIQLLCWDNLCNGPCDFCIFGEINEMELYWSFKNIDLPSERFILPQYFENKNINYDFTYESMKKLCDTYLWRFKPNINWLKNDDESPLNEHFANKVIYR